jgi:hypothetical protein
MKISEKVHLDTKDDKIIIESTYSNQPYIEQVKNINKQGLGTTGENKLIGRIPVHLIKEWCNEAGVKWGDLDARKEVMKRKILSGDFDKLRVWKGTY